MDQCSLWREREATGLSLAVGRGGRLPLSVAMGPPA